MAASEDSFVFPNRHDGCECLICKNVPVNRAPVFDLYRVVKVKFADF